MENEKLEITRLGHGSCKILSPGAKTIYLDILGPEQTQDMFYAFAEGLENHEYKQVTIH